MQCPKCSESMEKVSTAHGVVDRCTNCRGLWFDMLEEVELRSYAKLLDDGDPEVGKRFNAIDKIDCPKCANNRMLRMVDPGQPHIWFESCPTCFGRFYDAGEFLDLNDNSLADVIKRFFGRARK